MSNFIQITTDYGTSIINANCILCAGHERDDGCTSIILKETTDNGHTRVILNCQESPEDIMKQIKSFNRGAKS